MNPTAPPPPSQPILGTPYPHVCMFLGFLCAHAGENSPNIQVVALCACVSANFIFSRRPVSLHKKGGLSDDSPRVWCHFPSHSHLS